MTELWRQNGGKPQELPSAFAYDAQGNAWGDLANSAEARAATGFVYFGVYDPAKERLVETADGWEFVPIIPPPPPVPVSVTMRQARLALLGVGLLSRADATIGALEGREGDAARIEWEYATELRRDHALVVELGRQFGLTDAQKDDLFRLAATL